MLEQPSERSKKLLEYYVSIRSFTLRQTHDSVNYNCAQKVFAMLERNERSFIKTRQRTKVSANYASELKSEIINLR